MKRVNRRPNVRRRASLLFSAALATAVITAAIAVPSVGAGQADDLAFSDGHWSGTVHYRTKLTAEGIDANSLASGGFDVTWAAGVPEGNFFADGSADSTIDSDTTGSFQISYAGQFAGTPVVPTVQGAGLTIFGQVTTQGLTVPVDLTLGPGELGSFNIDIRSATCIAVSGDFASAIAAANDILGGSATLTAQLAMWSAIRTGDGASLTEVQNSTLNDLLTAADEFELAAAAGTFDSAKLLDLLHQAEQFTYSLERNADCGRASPGSYNTVLSGMIIRIVDAMIGNAGAFDASDWQAAVLAAVAAGTLGTGSGPSGAALAAKVTPILQGVLDVAIADANAADMFAIALAAKAMGAEALYNEAFTAYKAAS